MANRHTYVIIEMKVLLPTVQRRTQITPARWLQQQPRRLLGGVRMTARQQRSADEAARPPRMAGTTSETMHHMPRHPLIPKGLHVALYDKDPHNFSFNILPSINRGKV